ncbi:AraC family transcriptional regulator [Chachezhania antarctica]|uniref:AraC family transcriptional regulator n=1 Tax=Chachezhania antarctica TaxID=2340860 RepID=UPI0013CE7EB2|nr:AraC family transcriptional regulator [Chachezhania antarctica]|tara:strand:+ start:11363 stop:12301 length:939 start_codon:yes stop_codon:yes gene_type:complete
MGHSEAFDYYREGICTTFMPLRPELDRAERKSFHADLRSHQIDDVVLNLVSASTHSVHRGTREIAASPVDCYYINTQLYGACQIEQKRKSVTLHMGDVGIFDGAEPFDLKHHKSKPLRVASLMVPKRLFGDAVREQLSNGPHVLSRQPVLGHLLSEAGRSLDTSPDRMGSDVLSRITQIVLSLTVVSAAPDKSRSTPASRSIALAHQIRQIIRQNSSRQDFNLADCAAQMGLSVGYIQQVLARNGERFGVILLDERLSAAARLLTDSNNCHLRVSTIAYAAGFKDISHFGRAFRNNYGQSPGELRRQTAVLD